MLDQHIKYWKQCRKINLTLQEVKVHSQDILVLDLFSLFCEDFASMYKCTSTCMIGDRRGQKKASHLL